jgi:hypothetical protein
MDGGCLFLKVTLTETTGIINGAGYFKDTFCVSSTPYDVHDVFFFLIWEIPSVYIDGRFI